jgi:hypothetical protein
MITGPVASLTGMDVWFVAPSGDWNRERTRDEFAMLMGPDVAPGETGEVVVTVHDLNTFSLDCCPGRTFSLELFGIAPGEWAFAVVEDRD